MSQPMPPPSTIPNNMVLAIVAVVVSLACCLPHGVVSLIFAMQVGKKEAAGDIEGATKAAGQAKLFAWISIIVGVVYFIFAMIFGVFGLIIGALGGGR